MSLTIKISLSLIQFIVVLCSLIRLNEAGKKYFGTPVGRLSELHHAVAGDVFAVDSRTLFIKGFNYDGEGPAAYFYVGNTRAPSNIGGFRIRDERGSNGVLKKYRNKDITLTLPEGKTLRDIKWFSIWCDEFSVNFGDVPIPSNLDFPRPQKVEKLSGVHAVSSDNIVIVDAQTLLIPNFSYDGEAPDAKFWVGPGTKPTPNGIRIPDENGKETPLIRYDKKTIVLTLPGDLSIFEIGHFGVWCEAFTVDFGHVKIPDKINVPPSLKMLGISPQSKLNCEVLHDDLAFEVRWAVAGESIVIQLVAKLEDSEYMSFGVSADPENSIMIGGDVTVAWVNKLTGKGYSQDYFLEAKSQCSGNRGSCPDTRLKDNTNSIRLLNAAMVNGYSIVTYQRPLRAADTYDQPIYVNGSQAIIWAIGPLNQRFEVSYHTQFLKKNKFIDFGRSARWNCPIPDEKGDGKPAAIEREEIYDNAKRPQTQKLSNERVNHSNNNNRNNNDRVQSDRPINDRIDAPKRPTVISARPAATPRPASRNGAWDIPPIQCFEPEDGVFYAQMGPTGGKQGYPAITGHVGWGISWYINGLLIPEINVVRGKTYTFVVEGGNDPDTPAKYHPFYITDDPIGGFEYKTEEERNNVKIYAGVQRSRNNKANPTGIGRLCNWTPDQDGPPADSYPSFGAYQRTLTLKCDEGEPGIISWTPDRNTPDTVYYQCFTHRYLGWKINVLDSCESAQASEVDEVFVEPEEDVIGESSIKHESKLLPSENFLQHHEKDLIKHHNMNGKPARLPINNLDLQKNTEISKLITDGIKTAEALEDSIRNKNSTSAQVFPRPYSDRNMQQNHPSSNNNKHNTNDEDHELLEAIAKIPQNNIKLMPGKPMYSPSGLPVYLRPPQSPNMPFYRPGKLPMRRPIALERRPMNRPQRPYLLPQQTMIVNQYKKPLNPYVRTFMKQKPIYQPNKPVMLLGEPTEIKPFKINSDVVIGKPSRSQVDIGPVYKQKPQSEMGQFGQSFKVKKVIQPTSAPLRGSKYPLKIPVKMEKNKNSFKDPFEIRKEEFLSREASNTGFKPDSVVVESGFKPIFRREDIINLDDLAEFERDKESQTMMRRRDDYISEIDEAIEGDALLINRDEQPSPYFGPMFIASPRDSVALAQIGNATDSNSQEQTTLEDKMVVEDGEDKIAVANERQDFFYLPPEGRKTVVTYDGKAVLDTTLLNSDPANYINRNDYGLLSSKTQQFIKDTPQFGPFKGEIPSDLILQISGNRAGSSISEYIDPTVIKDKSAISTKLSVVKSVDAKSFRVRRNAHHTPDHHEDHDHHHSSSDASRAISITVLSVFSILLSFTFKL